MNQCSSHRSGTACGSCEESYTLSFDSVDCVNVDKCTTGQTVLVVTLSMIYWIVIVILVFIMTYYHVGIGYLYAITYFYSMQDIESMKVPLLTLIWKYGKSTRDSMHP